MDERSRWRAAYRATDYCVLLPGQDDLVLRVDRHDADADRKLREQCGVQARWAIVTPCNPASQILDEAANTRRLRECEAELEQLGVRHYPARNHDPHGKWLDEPGFLLCDPLPGTAEQLGRDFGQNAILAGAPGKAPRVVWLV